MSAQMTFRVPRSRAFETHTTLRAEIEAALAPLLYGHMGAGYAARAAFETDFAAFVQQKHGVGVHSGTAGLFIALKACGVGPGDEVITVGNSDISTTAAIHHCGATSVLCDVLPTDYTIDVSQVEALITTKTRALLPVDLHGHPADVRALRTIAEAHGLRIIEDAALAAGACDHGEPVGHFADVTVFSFAPYKPLGSVGNGAMLVTSADDLAHKLRMLVGYGHAPTKSLIGAQHYIDEGFNVPLDTLQAALLGVKLPYLAVWTAQRQQIASAYAEGLADVPIDCPSFRAEAAPTFRSYTICVEDQQRVFEGLRAAGIEIVLHYKPPAYQHPVYGGALRNSENLPVTDHLAAHLINLPVTPELTTDDTDYVIDVLRALVS